MVEASQATGEFQIGWVRDGIVPADHPSRYRFFSYAEAGVWPLLRGERDPRFDRPSTRLARDLEVLAGTVEATALSSSRVSFTFVIFAGFLVLSVRSLSLVLMGISGRFAIARLLCGIPTTSSRTMRQPWFSSR